MLSREVLEIILIFSTASMIILIIVLLYHYIKDKLKNSDFITRPDLNLFHRSKNRNKNDISKLDEPLDLNKIKHFKNLDSKIYKKEKGGQRFSNKKSNNDNLEILNNEISQDDKLNDEIIFNKNSKDENYAFVAKSWEEPMRENHKDIISNFADVQKKSKEESDHANINISSTDETPTSYYEKELDKEIFSLIDDASPKKNIDNESLEKKKLSKGKKSNLKPPSPKNQSNKIKHNNLNNQATTDIETKLSLGKQIIFYYNNETYSSEILEIKHANVKVIYRGKYRWIQIKDIRKIF